mmetsp:Transcript_6172/g.15262  ORF Transcript_6172/g.15262 Transcript_6172/m.15262 type:complete len:344 (+) Transcript_6172:20-1051(+)
MLNRFLICEQSERSEEEACGMMFHPLRRRSRFDRYTAILKKKEKERRRFGAERSAPCVTRDRRNGADGAAAFSLFLSFAGNARLGSQSVDAVRIRGGFSVVGSASPDPVRSKSQGELVARVEERLVGARQEPILHPPGFPLAGRHRPAEKGVLQQVRLHVQPIVQFDLLDGRVVPIRLVHADQFLGLWGRVHPFDLQLRAVALAQQPEDAVDALVVEEDDVGPGVNDGFVRFAVQDFQNGVPDLRLGILDVVQDDRLLEDGRVIVVPGHDLLDGRLKPGGFLPVDVDDEGVADRVLEGFDEVRVVIDPGGDEGRDLSYILYESPHRRRVVHPHACLFSDVQAL